MGGKMGRKNWGQGLIIKLTIMSDDRQKHGYSTELANFTNETLTQPQSVTEPQSSQIPTQPRIPHPSLSTQLNPPSRRKLCKPSTSSSQNLKRNLLKIKQSRKILQLKQLTSTNLQMFIRIRSQSTHYPFFTSNKQSSKSRILTLNSRLSKACPLTDRNLSQPQQKPRCQSAIPVLYTKCNQYKHILCNSKPKSSRQSPTQQLNHDHQSQVNNFIIKRKKDDKQNQKDYNKQINKKQIISKVIANKLGNVMEGDCVKIGRIGKGWVKKQNGKKEFGEGVVVEEGEEGVGSKEGSKRGRIW